MIQEFRLPLYSYITTSIEVPPYQKEQVFFPLHKESSKNLEIIQGLKYKQLQQILENKLYRSQEAKEDIGLLNAAINWFENHSDNFFHENNLNPNLESALIIIQDEKSYTIISIDSYFELKNQIQLSALQNIPEKLQRKWAGRYSEAFIKETIENTPFHNCKKCRVFKNLEKRIETTLIKINKKFQSSLKTFR